LADDRAAGGLPRRVREARALYEGLVERDLVRPLQEWALASADPVVRSAGLELAAASGLLHRMSPLLADLQASRFERARDGGLEPVPAGALGQYLTLAGRFGSLLRDLRRWRGA
jgi:hypothetical protein